MSDTIKAIHEDQENYLRLCQKYGDTPELGDSRSAGKYVNPYCAHAKELQQRELDDEQMKMPGPQQPRGTANRRKLRVPITEQSERRGIVERRRSPHANVISEGHRVRGEIAKALYGEDKTRPATEMQMQSDDTRAGALFQQLLDMAEVVRQIMLKPVVKPCVWTLEDAESSTYKTGCGELFEFTDGDASTNGFHFCFYCGGAIQ